MCARLVCGKREITGGRVYIRGRSPGPRGEIQVGKERVVW